MSSIDFRKTKTDGVIHDGEQRRNSPCETLEWWWVGSTDLIFSQSVRNVFRAVGLMMMISGRNSRICALHGTCWLGCRSYF